MVLRDFDLWPMFDLSPHKFRRAVLSLRHNKLASLPEQVSKAWVHTLNLSCCQKLVDISALGGCGSLHTLNLSSCSGLVDISALGGCSSLRTLYLSCCSGLKGVTFPGVEVRT